MTELYSDHLHKIESDLIILIAFSILFPAYVTKL